MDESDHNKHEKYGLKGWLIAPFVMLLYSIVSHVQSLQNGIYYIVKSGLWSSLTTQGNDIYQSFWAPYLISESVATIILIVVSAIAIWLFIKRNRYLPRVMIGIYVYGVIIAVSDFMASYLLVYPSVKDLYEAMKQPLINQVLVASILALVWIPYFILSKRVKNTFAY